MISPVEKLRKVWTPTREIEEVVHALDPQTELDSQIRDYLHRAVQQFGPMKLLLELRGEPVLNTGSLRFEIVHFAPTENTPGHREVTLWIED